MRVSGAPGFGGFATRSATIPEPFNPQFVSATPADYSATSTADVSVTLPARDVGDRLILFLTRSTVNTDAIAAPSGWTPLDASSFTGTASSFTRAYYQDVTVANVGAATANFTGGDPSRSVSLVYRLSGCDPSVAPVANGTLVNVNTSTCDPDTLLGPNSGAAQRNLWIAYLGVSVQDSANGVTPVVTTWPTTYGNTGTTTTTTSTGANGCGQGWGSKVATVGSDNPSAWAYNPTATGRSLAINVAIRGVIG